VNGGSAAHNGGRAAHTGGSRLPGSRATIQGSPRMNLIPQIGPAAALVAGILILLMPRLLNYIVAIYLIVTGAVGLFGR